MKKIPYFSVKLVQRIKKDPDKVHTTWSRSTTILPEMIGCVVGVHNGKIFIPVHITEKMVGTKLGEYSPTRFARKRSKR